MSNAASRVHPLKHATESKACLPLGAASVSLDIQPDGYFFNVATHCSESTEAALSSLCQQTFYRMKEQKCNFF